MMEDPEAFAPKIGLDFFVGILGQLFVVRIIKITVSSTAID